MLIQAGKDVLYGFADTPEQFAEASAYWAGVLIDTGIEPGVPTFENRIFTLPYRAPGGRVLRNFMAETRQFPPKDDAGLRANMAAAQKTLSAAGLTPISARVVNLEYLLPTYSILYLAKPEAARKHETLIRVLKSDNAIDPDLLKESGVTVVQTPEPWLVVYIGPELGFVRLLGKTPEDLVQRLAAHKAHLVEAGKRIIGEKLTLTEHPEYKHAAALLFFQ
jgi:hypothetical protein